MPDGERRYWITFNGEIYNYLELAESAAPARPLISAADPIPKCLLAAYRQWGTACVDRLRGMFAFAVWDEHEQRLFAARDRLGIKPFHYWVNPDENAARVRVRDEGAARVPAGRSRSTRGWPANFSRGTFSITIPLRRWCEGILRLPAGHWLTWNRDEGVDVQRYWTFEVNEDLRSSPAERAKRVAGFREQFTESISHPPALGRPGGKLSERRARFVVDRLCGQPGAEGARGRERRLAAHVQCLLRRAGSGRAPLHRRGHPDHSAVTTIRCFPTAAGSPEKMDTWLWHQEEPVGGFGVYSQFCVARLAREHGIKVLLDGQGADEQLLGYRKFILAYVRQLVHSGRYLRAARESLAFFLRSKEFLAGSSLAEGMRYWSRSIPEGPQLWRRVGAPPPAGRLAWRRRWVAAFMRTSPRSVCRCCCGSKTATAWPSDWSRACRSSTTCWSSGSRGCRRIFDCGTAGRNASCGTRSATCFRRSCAAARSKLGFNTPDAKWLSGPLKQWLYDTLARPAHLPAVVDPAGVAHLLALHRQHRASSGNVAMLLRLALFEHWGTMFLATGTRMANASAYALKGAG